MGLAAIRHMVRCGRFKADLGSALCRRFLTDDMDGLAAAYLKQGDGWVATRTRNVRKLAERLAEACLEHCDTIDEWHTVTDARKVGERLRKG